MPPEPQGAPAPKAGSRSPSLGPIPKYIATSGKATKLWQQLQRLTQELSDNKARSFLEYLLLLCLFLSFCVFMHKYAHIYTPTCHTLINANLEILFFL